MAKIEELTLYVIQAEKRTDQVEQENAQLKARLEAIERKLGLMAER